MNEETKLSLLLRVALATAFTCVAVKWMVDQLDPTRDKKNKAKQQAQALMSKLKIKTNIQVPNPIKCVVHSWKGSGKFFEK